MKSITYIQKSSYKKFHKNFFIQSEKVYPVKKNDNRYNAKKLSCYIPTQNEIAQIYHLIDGTNYMI